MSEYRPDWSKAPEWARFWALDSDGGSWWYERRPDAGSVNFGNGGTRDRDTNACPNWRETLQERPGNNATEIRTIREELKALAERLMKLEDGA
jgi:hypothetical protein